MPDPIGDTFRQQAHAEQIREQSRQRRMSPEQRDHEKAEAGIERMVANRVAQEVAKILAQFTIQSGNCIKVSGSGRNMTIAWEQPAQTAPGLTGPTEGEWRSVTDCDNVTFDVWVRF